MLIQLPSLNNLCFRKRFNTPKIYLYSQWWIKKRIILLERQKLNYFKNDAHEDHKKNRLMYTELKTFIGPIHLNRSSVKFNIYSDSFIFRCIQMKWKQSLKSFCFHKLLQLKVSSRIIQNQYELIQFHTINVWIRWSYHISLAFVRFQIKAFSWYMLFSFNTFRILIMENIKVCRFSMFTFLVYTTYQFLFPLKQSSNVILSW